MLVGGAYCIGYWRTLLAINLKHQRLMVNFPNPGVCAKSLQTMITYLLNNTRLGRVILAVIGLIAVAAWVYSIVSLTMVLAPIIWQTVSYIEGNTQSPAVIEPLSPLTMVAAIVMAYSSSVVFANVRTRLARA
jgi:hypothetical protein